MDERFLQIYLVRHGESAANTGDHDPQLEGEERAQAEDPPRSGEAFQGERRGQGPPPSLRAQPHPDQEVGQAEASLAAQDAGR